MKYEWDRTGTSEDKLTIAELLDGEPTLRGRPRVGCKIHNEDYMRTKPSGARWCVACGIENCRRYYKAHRKELLKQKKEKRNANRTIYT